MLSALAFVAALQPPTLERTSASVAIVVSDNPCVRADTVRGGLAQTLEIALELPLGDDAEATLDVAIEPRALGWDIELHAHGHGRELQRSLVVEDPACAELEAAIGLVGALLLDDLLAVDATIRVPARRRAPAAVEPPPHADPAAAPTPPRPPPWALRAAASARMSVGDFPGVAGGVVLESLVSAPRFVSFGVQMIAWPYRRVAHASFTAVDLAVPVCVDPVRWRAWALSVCGAPRAGVLVATGLDLPDSRAALRPRVLLDVVLDMRVRLVAELWLRLHVGAAAVVLRDRFIIAGTDPSSIRRVIHRAWPIVPLAGLGLEFRAKLAGR